jgi:hypothetical protein
MALDKFRASPLPNPPSQWDPQYMRQVIRVLETYFSQLDSRTPNNAQQYTADFFYGSGIGLIVPYNQFQSKVDQTLPAIDQAVAVQLEVTDFVDGITITGVNNTRITFGTPGIYTLTYSLSFKNPTNDAQFVDIWYRYNDGTTTTDVVDSNMRFTIPPRKSTGEPAHLVAVTPYTGFAGGTGVWVEIMWTATSTSVTLEHLPAVAYSAGVTPAHPATPSAIVQANFVSKPV